MSGQLVHWLFEQMRPGTRAQLDARRADVFPRAVESAYRYYPGTAGGARGLTIGMHVRRGDSCALGSRFCPRNKTAAYFEMAARLRAQYPAMQRLVVATDDEEAAALCASRVLGFECITDFNRRIMSIYGLHFGLRNNMDIVKMDKSVKAIRKVPLFRDAHWVYYDKNARVRTN